jgi:hypothetical protein
MNNAQKHNICIENFDALKEDITLTQHQSSNDSRLLAGVSACRSTALAAHTKLCFAENLYI